jgi:hypothetical protein
MSSKLPTHTYLPAEKKQQDHAYTEDLSIKVTIKRWKGKERATENDMELDSDESRDYNVVSPAENEEEYIIRNPLAKTDSTTTTTEKAPRERVHPRDFPINVIIKKGSYEQQMAEHEMDEDSNGTLDCIVVRPFGETDTSSAANISYESDTNMNMDIDASDQATPSPSNRVNFTQAEDELWEQHNLDDLENFTPELGRPARNNLDRNVIDWELVSARLFPGRSAAYLQRRSISRRGMKVQAGAKRLPPLPWTHEEHLALLLIRDHNSAIKLSWRQLQDFPLFKERGRSRPAMEARWRTGYKGLSREELDARREELEKVLGASVFEEIQRNVMEFHAALVRKFHLKRMHGRKMFIGRTPDSSVGLKNGKHEKEPRFAKVPSVRKPRTLSALTQSATTLLARVPSSRVLLSTPLPRTPLPSAPTPRAPSASVSGPPTPQLPALAPIPQPATSAPSLHLLALAAKLHAEASAPTSQPLAYHPRYRSI